MALLSHGSLYHGGDATSVADLTNVRTVTSSSGAFAALKNDGTVVSWGGIAYGGDSSSVAADLSNVAKVYSTIGAFASKMMEL